jgi:peptide/nickel transport system substrate-binding protein
LQPGLKFASGRGIDAAAVCANLADVYQNGSRSFNAVEYSHIQRAVAVDDHQVVVELELPFPALFAVLANGFGIVDPEGGMRPDNLTGGGVFAMTRLGGHSLRLRRTTGDGEPEIEWRFCTTRRARENRIKHGNADIILDGTAGAVARRKGWTLVRQHGGGPVHLAFNMRRWPTSALSFRRAAAEAVDAVAVIQSAFGGEARRASSPYSSDSAHAIAVEDFDAPGEAPPKPTATELVFAVGGEAVLPAARLVARAIATAAGFRIRVVSVPNEKWWPRYYLGGEWDMALQAWTPMPDPYLVYGRRYTSTGIHNGPGYSNPHVDSLVKESNRTIDPDARRRMFRDVETLRRRDIPTLYLAFPNRLAWMRPGIAGLQLRTSWAVDLSDLKVARW